MCSSDLPQLLIHTPRTSVRFDLPWSFSTFDYRTLCELLAQQGRFEFETATVTQKDGTRPEHVPAGGSAHVPTRAGAHAPRPQMIEVQTDRGPIRAPLVVDALGWRRVLGDGEPIQPPEAFLSRGLEVHPFGSGNALEVWIDRSYVPAGYGWSFPADGEVRVGVGSFDPRFHVKEPTVRLASDLERDAVRYQGNWIPHRLRPAAEDGVFFVGDSAGHCLPLTAEGIRTALYFGLACGRELREVIEGRSARERALERYASFSAGHRWKFEALLRMQQLIPRVAPPLLARSLRAMERKQFVDWAFGHYLEIAHPRFVGNVAVAA